MLSFKGKRGRSRSAQKTTDTAHLVVASHPLHFSTTYTLDKLQTELSISVLNSTRKKAGIIEILCLLKTNIEAQFI